MLNGLGSDTFAQFIRNVNARRPGYVTELFGWFARPEGDFIGKQEHLADDFIKVLTLMNVTFDEDRIRGCGRVGASPEPESEIIWPEPLKIETALYEFAGIVRYGYAGTLDDMGLDHSRLIGRAIENTPRAG